MVNGQPAQRAYYEMEHGEISHGLEIHHLCANTECVNPAHLIAVSRTDHRKIHRALRTGEIGLSQALTDRPSNAEWVPHRAPHIGQPKSAAKPLPWQASRGSPPVQSGSRHAPWP